MIRGDVIVRKKNITGIFLAAVLLLAGCAGRQSTGPINEAKDPVEEAAEEESINEEPETAELPEVSEPEEEPEEVPAEPEEEEEEEDEPEVEVGPPFSDSIDISTSDGKSTTYFYALDTYISMTVYGSESENAVKDAVNIVDRLERILSTEMEGSELRVLNENGNAICSEELIEAVTLGQEYGENTDGTFNIALYPIDDAWGFFQNRDYRVPEESEIKELLALAHPEDAVVTEMASREWSNGRKNSKLKKGIVFETEGMKLDLGGIAKGYIGDKIAELFTTEYSEGVTGAVISLGGNITCIGKKPDGKQFKVGLQDPAKDVGQYCAVVTAAATDGTPVSIVTSGDYERCFEVDGIKYHHIIDPQTGYPADSGLSSVSVISENSTLADALTTALFVMGYDEAVEFWKSGRYDFEMILIDKNGKLYITEGLRNTVTKNTLPMEVIGR